MRDDLVVHDLVAYQAPLTQVLSLPRPRVERGGPAARQALLRTPSAEEPSAASKEKPMKVALWAEIRRLKEIEKLSQRAIARLLGVVTRR